MRRASSVTKMKIKYRNKVAIAVVLACLCVVCVLFISWMLSSTHGAAQYHSWASTVPIDQTKPYPVSQVVDGDTIKAIVDGHSITIRLLGINAPETVKPNWPVECYGPEASAEMKSLLTGKSVLLSLNPSYERIDKYGRLLAYVRLEDASIANSEMFVNEYFIKEGYAREYTFNEKNPYQYQKQFQDDEVTAKAAGKGLWGKCK
jgi:micrococcal nuclease